LGSSATVNLVVVANNNSNLAAAVTAAQAADIAIVMAGVVTSEGSDRPNLSLPNNQDALISAVAAAAPGKTVLVLKDGDAVLMPWIDQVPALLEAWNPGQEDGNIVADLLFGVANPSGKLPITYPRQTSDTPTSTPDRYPGITPAGQAFPSVFYSEALQMGYRWYDAQHIDPLFPFGYGLSYTTFALSNLTVSPKLSNGTQPITLAFDVQNTGTRAGAEVPQVYVQLPSATGEPPKRLVAFQKVTLQPGEKRRVSMTVDPAATNHPLSIFDSTAQNWKTMAGGYPLYVGTSSRNLALSDVVKVIPGASQ
jgi:beta-glucosidase